LVQLKECPKAVQKVRTTAEKTGLRRVVPLVDQMVVRSEFLTADPTADTMADWTV
jgi:hypothetical protein